MYRLALIIIFVLGLKTATYSQYIRPDTYFSVGYQYSNFGNSFAQSSTQMEGMNQSAIDENHRFKNDRNAYGLVLRFMLVGNQGLTSEFALGNKKVISKMTYFDSLNNTEIDVTTKQRMRYLSYGLHYATGRWTFGASLDLGVFASLKREKGSAIESENQWHPWFYTQKVLGSGITGKTPVVGWTLSTGFALSQFTEIRLYKQFTAFGMGADYTDNYFSLSNWGVELAFTFGQ